MEIRTKIIGDKMHIPTPALDLAPTTAQPTFQEVRILMREGPTWRTLTVQIDFTERTGLKPMRFMEDGKNYICDVWTRVVNDRVDYYEDVCLEALDNGLNPHLEVLPCVMKIRTKRLDKLVDA